MHRHTPVGVTPFHVAAACGDGDDGLLPFARNSHSLTDLPPAALLPQLFSQQQQPPSGMVRTPSCVAGDLASAATALGSGEDHHHAHNINNQQQQKQSLNPNLTRAASPAVSAHKVSTSPPIGGAAGGVLRRLTTVSDCGAAGSSVHGGSLGLATTAGVVDVPATKAAAAAAAAAAAGGGFNGPPQGWVAVSGRYVSVMAVVTACRSDKSKAGLVPGAHLTDGRMYLVLVRECSRLQYLRFLLRLASRGIEDGCFPFVQVWFGGWGVTGVAEGGWACVLQAIHEECNG
jgi:hypothetical protein